MAGIFISYRRDDAPSDAGRIGDRLIQRFGADQVFFDVDAIPPGEDFVTVLENKLGICDALLVVVGRGWLNSQDAQGNRRIEKPRDFVRMEIALALQRDILTLPVLVNNAVMPSADDLPADLQRFSRKQATEIRHLSFHKDVELLIHTIAATRKTRAGLLAAKGQTAYNSRQFEAAMSHWQEVLLLDPENKDAANLIEGARSREAEARRQEVAFKSEATVAIARHDYEHAAEVVRSALALGATDPDLSSLLRDAETKLTEHREQESKFARVRELTSKGHDLFLARRYAEAQLLWGEALAMSPHNEALRGLIQQTQIALARTHQQLPQAEPRTPSNQTADAPHQSYDAAGAHDQVEPARQAAVEPPPIEDSNGFPKLTLETSPPARPGWTRVFLYSAVALVLIAVGTVAVRERLDSHKSKGQTKTPIIKPEETKAAPTVAVRQEAETKPVAAAPVSRQAEAPARFSSLGNFDHVTGSWAFSPDGEYLWLDQYDQASKKRTLSRWGFLSRTKKEEMEVEFTGVTASPDGRWLAATQKTEVLILDAVSRSVVTRLEVGTAAESDRECAGLAFHPSGRFLACVSYKEPRIAIVWEIPTKRRVLEYKSNEISGFYGAEVTFSPDGNYFAYANRELRVWKVGSWSPERRVVDKGTSATIFSPDSTFLAAAFTGTAGFKLWKTADWSEYATVSGGSTAALPSLSFSPDGRYLLSTGHRARADGIWLWDVKERQLAQEIQSPAGVLNMTVASFNPRLPMFLVAKPNETIEVYGIKGR